MWQTIITVLVVLAALIYIGRRLYRNLRQAIDPSTNVSCGCSSGCDSCTSSCDDAPEKIKHHES